jgi:Flp pilus assembly protein TadD
LLLVLVAGAAGCSLGPRQVITTQAVEVPAEMSAHQRLEEIIRVADAARQSGNFSNAADLYRKAIAEGVDTLEIHLDLAESLLGSGDITAALSEYELVRDRAPTDARAEIGLGRLNLIRRQPALALAAYSLALQDSPGNLVAINGEGVALDLLGRHLDAQARYRQGLAENPDERTLRNNLGLSLVFTKDYDEAVAILTRLAQEPDATARNRQNLALALGMEGDSSDAKMVAAHDLDDASVENNLRYYDYMRGAAPAGGADPAIAAPQPTP